MMTSFLEYAHPLCTYKTKYHEQLTYAIRSQLTQLFPKSIHLLITANYSLPQKIYSLCHCIMGRSPCCEENVGVKKGPWTPEEDEKLIDYISKHGHGSWRTLPKRAGLNRCGKSCRLRWTNYLTPDIKRGKFSEEDERIIINLHSVLGNKYVHVFLLCIYT